MRLKTLFVIWLFAACSAVAQQASAPVLFFTDLKNGPATGNTDSTYTSSGGVYVTLYGNFLDNFSSIKLNGSACLHVVSNPAAWMWYEKMTVQLTSTCTSGNWSITTPSGTFTGPMVATPSGSNDFTVNASNIYYVSTSGNDSGSGSFSAPWATLPHAVDTAGTTAGNVIYAENGVSQTTDDGNGWNAAVTLRQDWCKGTLTQPNYLVAYPGATVTVGARNNNSLFGVRSTGDSATGGPCMGRWTVAELNIGGGASANAISWDGPSADGSFCPTCYPTGGSYGWRAIGNDLSCPYAAGQTGCLHTGNTDNNGTGRLENQFLGNNVHDVGNLAPQPNTDQQHGLYLGDQSRWFELGWNTVSNVQACRGIQVYSNFNNEFAFSIHDNTIHDATCNGILLERYTSSTSVPITNPGVKVFNNVIYNTGKGPMPSDGGGDFSGIYTDHYTGGGYTAGSGTTYVGFNTIYDSGSILDMSYGSCSDNASVNVQDDDPEVTNFYNNVMFQTGTNSQCSSGLPYWTNGSGNSSPVPMIGYNNLMWSTSPAQTPPGNTSSTVYAGTINSDPKVTNATVSGCPSSCATDLHLSTASSPAVGAGTTSYLIPTYDHDGLLRPSPPSIGAYEFTAGSEASKPAPPTGLSAVVN